MRSSPATLPVVAIVGRPNVGKSALFNRIAKKKIAIVHEESGVTRDRVSSPVEWMGRQFLLVDTGGIAQQRGEKIQDAITAEMRKQSHTAIREASVVVLVVDGSVGITPLDEEVARQVRKSGRRVLLAVNKVDSQAREESMAEFSRLGFHEMFAVSALHGRKVDELLDAVIKALPETTQPDLAPHRATPLCIAIVGKPNVGKSSLVNALVKTDRVIVTAIPGTTRDAVDVPFILKQGKTERDSLLIDTAGIRPVGRVKDSVELFSVMRSENSIGRCDIAVLVIDAKLGVTAQDQRVGGKIAEAHKGCVIVVNKWDLMKGAERAQQLYEKRVRHDLFFLNYAPIVFVSAKHAQGLSRLAAAILLVDQQLDATVQTAVLNRALDQSVSAYLPPQRFGRHLRVYYGNQIGSRPPTFLVFVNDPTLLAPHYQRYLCDQLRKRCGFAHAPVKLIFRGR
jgi:GTP-binding protein